MRVFDSFQAVVALSALTLFSSCNCANRPAGGVGGGAGGGAGGGLDGGGGGSGTGGGGGSGTGGGGGSGTGGGGGAGGSAGGVGGGGATACSPQLTSCTASAQCCGGLICGASGSCQVDPGSGCGPNSIKCNNVCVVTLTDPANCGACGKTCGANEVCTQAACRPPAACGTGTVACAGRCVDTGSDSLHCGGCPGIACAAGKGCAGGVCVASVPTDGGGPACLGGGPPIFVKTDAGSQCTGALAQVTFRFGICACDSLIVSSGDLNTDGFDSNKPGQDAGGLGGSIAANRRVNAGSFFDVGGSVWSGGDAGFFNSANGSRIRQDLVSNGPAAGAGLATVFGDARVNGDVTTRLNVRGKLYVPTAATIGGMVTADAGVVRGAVLVGPPCDCSANQLIDVAGIVASGQASNDNALLGLDPAALANPPAARRLDLPCGRYFLTKITPGFNTTIGVHGRTALFLEGNLDTSQANVEIAIDPQAELDIFIGGTILNSTGLTLGNIEVPAQLRVYIAGSPVDFSAPSKTAGNFYLPNSDFLSPSNLDLYGSIFARNFDGQGAVHYDRGVLSVGSACGPPPDGGAVCASCRDCGNQACVAGKCGGCTSSAQCCAPLECLGGTCVGPIN